MPALIGALHVIILCAAAPSAAATSHRAILLFLPLALMSALLNSSVPPLYPHYQQALALSDVSLTLIYGGYAGGVLISLFGVGNLAGRVSDLRAMILPALLAVLGAPCCSPWRTLSGRCCWRGCWPGSAPAP